MVAVAAVAVTPRGVVVTAGEWAEVEPTAADLVVGSVAVAEDLPAHAAADLAVLALVPATAAALTPAAAVGLAEPIAAAARSASQVVMP
jgi:hypothetical protein